MFHILLLDNTTMSTGLGPRLRPGNAETLSVSNHMAFLRTTCSTVHMPVSQTSAGTYICTSARACVGIVAEAIFPLACVHGRITAENLSQALLTTDNL